MQVKDQDYPSTKNWELIDESRPQPLANGFRRGLGFGPSSIDEDETVSGSIDYDSEPEQLDEKDRVGDDTRPRK
jgi:hypothetical protein